MTIKDNKMNTEQKLMYYNDIVWNIPFRDLYHTIVTCCEFVKPVYPEIQHLKYINFFFEKIDFDKIVNNPNKTESINYYNSMCYVLDSVFKADISKAILNYQKNISRLSKEQIQETQIKLIEIIGSLKIQSRDLKTGTSFSERCVLLNRSIRAKETLSSYDYQILIAHFNETIANDLLSSFEIINETFKELAQIVKPLPSESNQIEIIKYEDYLRNIYFNPNIPLKDKEGVTQIKNFKNTEFQIQKVFTFYKVQFEQKFETAIDKREAIIIELNEINSLYEKYESNKSRNYDKNSIDGNKCEYIKQYKLNKFDKNLSSELLLFVKTIARYVYFKEYLEKKLIEINQQPENKSHKEQKKLSELITNINSIEIVEAIKVQYKNIKGKKLKIMLMALQNTTPPLLPKERIAKKFHEACKIEFNWKISSYNAMNDYKYNERIDADEYNSMLTFLQHNIEIQENKTK